MKETLTRGEAQVVIADLNKELEKVKAEIKNRGVFGGAMEVLQEKSDLIQKKLDNLLKKGGLITEEDFNESYNLIRAKSQRELVDLRSKASKNFYLYLGGFIALGVVVYLLIRKK